MEAASAAGGIPLMPCRSCRNLVSRASIYCMVCGHLQKATDVLPDARVVALWAVSELRLPDSIRREIAMWAPRSLSGGSSRWSPYSTKLLPLGRKGRTLVYPGDQEPSEHYGGYPAMWSRYLAPGWGKIGFSVLLSTSGLLLENLYLVGVCLPTDFERDTHSFAAKKQPMRAYPRRCFALMLGGPTGNVELAHDGEGIVSEEVEEPYLTDEADKVLITLVVDTCAHRAQFLVNGIALQHNTTLPEHWVNERVYPFVVLNTVGDSVEWIG
ncbi:hypothetical protein DIPPA_23636 [Diplonema papillatum]|nr:hypothetical protein DIPPA_23636 [Diplonema papillatum]|eukprot:gene11173-17180_t